MSKKKLVIMLLVFVLPLCVSAKTMEPKALKAVMIDTFVKAKNILERETIAEYEQGFMEVMEENPMDEEDIYRLAPYLDLYHAFFINNSRSIHMKEVGKYSAYAALVHYEVRRESNTLMTTEEAKPVIKQLSAIKKQCKKMLEEHKYKEVPGFEKIYAIVNNLLSHDQRSLYSPTFLFTVVVSEEKSEVFLKELDEAISVFLNEENGIDTIDQKYPGSKPYFGGLPADIFFRIEALKSFIRKWHMESFIPNPDWKTIYEIEGKSSLFTKMAEQRDSIKDDMGTKDLFIDDPKELVRIRIREKIASLVEKEVEE